MNILVVGAGVIGTVYGAHLRSACALPTAPEGEKREPLLRRHAQLAPRRGRTTATSRDEQRQVWSLHCPSCLGLGRAPTRAAVARDRQRVPVVLAPDLRGYQRESAALRETPQRCGRQLHELV